MDINQHFQGALDYFAPFFSCKKPSLAEFLEPDPSIAEYADFIICNVLRHAGANVGLYFLAECNQGKFEQDPPLSGLLTLTFRQYSANTYHNEKCALMHSEQTALEARQALQCITTCLSNQEQLTGRQRLRLQACSVVQTAEALGALLARQHSGNKLGEFAAMDAKQAMRFLEQAVELESKRN